MPTFTPNYDLAMFDNTTDISETFQSYRNEMCFTSGSNVTKIEAALTAQQDSIDSLESTKGAVTVPSVFDAGSLFEATGISGITSYVTDMKILISVDQDSNGTVTLNINSLGIKSVLKIDDSGSAVNLENNDLRKGVPYFLTYNGTAWILVGTNYHIVQNEGSDVSQRERIDFQGASVLVQDGTNATEVIVDGAKLSKNIETLSGTKTLVDADEPIQTLDPDGSHRDVELPAEATTNPFFIIQNSAGGAENLVVKSDAPATITTLGQGESAIFVSDGVNWVGFYLHSEGAYMLGSTYDPATISEQVVGLTATQSLSNKTLESAIIDTLLNANSKPINNIDTMVLDEGGTLTTPASGKVRIYAKADGLLYSKDDGGVEKLISSGQGMLASTYDASAITEQLVGLTATQELTNKTLTNPAISNPTGLDSNDVGLSNVDNTSDATKNAAVATLENKRIKLGIPDSNETAIGIIVDWDVDTNSVGFHGLLRVGSDGSLDMADADAIATAPAVAMALETGTGIKEVLLMGMVRDDSWNWTLGAGEAGLIYLSTATGELTQTQPSGSGDVVQVVGYAITVDVMMFNPSLNTLEIA